MKYQCRENVEMLGNRKLLGALIKRVLYSRKEYVMIRKEEIFRVILFGLLLGMVLILVDPLEIVWKDL